MGLLNIQNNGIYKMEDLTRIENEEISLEDINPCTDYKSKQLERIEYWKKEFNINAELFDQFMSERILPNHCTFFQSYGRICKKEDIYIFPKLGGEICPYCLK